MKVMIMKRMLRFLLIVICVLFLAAGCGSAPPEDPPEEAPADEPIDIRTPVVGALTLDDGRKTEGFAAGKIGDELTNVFFSFRINKAELTEEFGEYKAERGFAYLVAEITVKNIFDGQIPMWATDFIAQWGEGDNDYCYPLDKSAGSQMENEFRLAKDQSVTRDLVYEVPLPQDKNEYGISYLEYYEDEVEGNLFLIRFELSAPQKPAEDDDDD